LTTLTQLRNDFNQLKKTIQPEITPIIIIQWVDPATNKAYMETDLSTGIERMIDFSRQKQQEKLTMCDETMLKPIGEE
jgi:hypothetical protein